jgi:hypothetical protein
MFNRDSDMRIRTFLIVMVLMFTVADIVKGEEKGEMHQEISLPTEAAGWKWDGKKAKYDSRTLFEYIDGAAELYLAYAFRNLAVRLYEKPNRPPITVELYEMASSEDAYGVFSFERQDEAIGIGQGSEFGGGLLRFWKGRYFVSIYADGEGAEVEPAMLDAGRATANSILAAGPEPKLVGLVPGKHLGLVDKSLRYLKSHVLLNQRFFISHQNILNLNRNTEAVLAQYLQGKQKTHLLLIRYPNLKEAGEAYRSFMQAYLPDAGGKDRLKTEDKKWTLARRQNAFVLIIFGASTETEAEALLKATEEKLGGGLTYRFSSHFFF